MGLREMIHSVTYFPCKYKLNPPTHAMKPGAVVRLLGKNPSARKAEAGHWLSSKPVRIPVQKRKAENA